MKDQRAALLAQVPGGPVSKAAGALWLFMLDNGAQGDLQPQLWA